MSERAIGQHVEPTSIPDDLAPGRLPSEYAVPVTGGEGPPAFVPVEGWEKMKETIDKLGQALSVAVANDPSGIASGNTDANGALVLGVYQVAAGDEFRPSRIVVEVAGYTPSAPYSAVGYCAIYALQTVNGLTVAQATALGGLRDAAAGSATQAFLPAIFEYGDHQAPRIRGPLFLAVVLSGAPASSMVTCYFQGRLRRMTGLT